ncbi:MAG TPA: aminopeptidase N [Caulobacteraceae bacterium]|jgi:aminopeptidase N
MRTETPPAVRLSDYRAPDFLVEEVVLEFDLEPRATRVKAQLRLRRQGAPDAPLALDGVGLKLLSVVVDGEPLNSDRYDVTGDRLIVRDAPDVFTLATEVEIDPAGNTALEGLYMSGGRFCTQCEAEGFRKITYYPDRPDVLSRFTVRMRGDRAAYPRLLANGNLVDAGEIEGEGHYAVWEDPFPKPAYLFALVAGELDVLEDRFTTMSGRRVELRIYVDPGMAGRAEYAMDSLKRAMAWDERAYGREYDLDLFMIVAVRDFNFGAMENKGLNIFNSSLLLADPQTATDLDYERIEAVVAHEYFHNWTGNRITCRDWFQLCLKEGFTVFRDQGFSEEMRGEAVQRIKQVRALRARQFAEDAGPLAHPVRPQAYEKIDNFYTATVYEKGAELIRMLKTLLGAEDFRRGADLYFERYDGTAATVEQFFGCFADAAGRDLKDFFGWYEQAGTPEVEVEGHWDEARRALELTLRQRTAPTPGQPEKRALPMPVRLGLLNENGAPMAFRLGGAAPAEEAVVVLEGPEFTVRLEEVPSRPVVSVFRGFSAPVRVKAETPAADRYLMLAADPDPFNRWEAGQALARDLILAGVRGAADAAGARAFAEAVGRALADGAADEAFKALLLALPEEGDMALAMAPAADPAAIHEAREALRRVLAESLKSDLENLHQSLENPPLDSKFSPDARSAGRRALRNATLDLLTAGGGVEARARRHFEAAFNMTDAMGGLSALMRIGGAEFEEALAAFYQRWRGEPLVIDKWFALQARDPSPGALGRVLGLTTHPAFDARNPNRMRALVQSFAIGNPARFHDPSGSGYRFLADQILTVDGFNPSTAARLVEALGGWRRYRDDLARLMRGELERIASTPGLSKNVSELVGKSLAGD